MKYDIVGQNVINEAAAHVSKIQCMEVDVFYVRWEMTLQLLIPTLSRAGPGWELCRGLNYRRPLVFSGAHFRDEEVHQYSMLTWRGG